MNNTPRFFSKTAIIVFSAIGTTFFGSLLYAENLREAKKSNRIVSVILFALLYNFLVFKLAPSSKMSLYYILIPFHLVGGLLFAGPFWKAQLGDIPDYKKRKTWGPAIAVLVPIAVIIYLNLHNAPHKMSAKEFQAATNKEGAEQMKKKLFVQKDSMVVFFDIAIPLLPYSYTFSTHVEDVNAIYDLKDTAGNRFSTVCMRMPLEPNEEFGLNLLGKEFSSLIVAKDCAGAPFQNMICADYTRKINDTAFVKGSVAMMMVDRMVYQYITQNLFRNKSAPDSLSSYLIAKIKAK